MRRTMQLYALLEENAKTQLPDQEITGLTDDSRKVKPGMLFACIRGEHFDGHTEPHYHFICTECGKVEDIFMEELQINKIAQDHFDGIIKGHQTYYYGICPKCNKKD